MPSQDPQSPRSGDLLRIGRSASVQFAGPNAITFRVIRVHDWNTTPGWLWLDGYQLNDAGDAVERRTIYVQPAGLSHLEGPHHRG